MELVGRRVRKNSAEMTKLRRRIEASGIDLEGIQAVTGDVAHSGTDNRGHHLHHQPRVRKIDRALHDFRVRPGVCDFEGFQQVMGDDGSVSLALVGGVEVGVEEAQRGSSHVERAHQEDEEVQEDGRRRRQGEGGGGGAGEGGGGDVMQDGIVWDKVEGERERDGEKGVYGGLKEQREGKEGDEGGYNWWVLDGGGRAWEEGGVISLGIDASCVRSGRPDDEELSRLASGLLDGGLRLKKEGKVDTTP